MEKLAYGLLIAFLVIIILVHPSSIIFAKKNVPIRNDSLSSIYLIKAVGKLKIDEFASTETYEAYFLVPISFENQVPILIEIDSPQLIDYRFVHLNSPNVIIAARLKRAPSTYLNWTAWILIQDNTHSDRPDSIPIPTMEQLPDSTRKWLIPTDCAQIYAPTVTEIATALCARTTDMIQLVQEIGRYCSEIPWTFTHTPISFDAVYSLRWGNSCTGHAHAGTALLRANGIPSRSLLNIPTGSDNYMDMHWIVDYYVPGYGWVKLETTSGKDRYNPKNTVVVFASNPEDEFPVFFPVGIDGHWHTSDPSLGNLNPRWGGAHMSFDVTHITDTAEKIQKAHDLTATMFYRYTDLWGIHLNEEQRAGFFNAYINQGEALSCFQNNDIDGYIQKMHEVLNHYEAVDLQPVDTIYHNNFEAEPSLWTHGGIKDEWEWGVPVYGPEKAHSGDLCWGIDLDNTYENNADCWLKSPMIDLRGKSCVFLSFWVWNSVQDMQTLIYDPLWLDLTTGNEQFFPICSPMGGINDDPEIPSVGGWNHIVLDLTKFADQTVQIRFRFQSDESNVWQGSYVDDVHVYGRSSDAGQIPVFINLEASRHTESAWLIEKDYGAIEVSVTKADYARDLNYTIYRLDTDLSFQILRKLTDFDFLGGNFSFIDQYLARDRSYRYIVVARDAEGKLVEFSSWKTI